MKKLFYCASLFAALTLASCGGKSTPSADADSLNNTVDTASADTALTATNADASALPEDAEDIASSLDEKLSLNDAKGVAALLEQAKTKAAELAKTDPEKAKEYITQIQEWVKKNASTLTENAKSTGDAALSSSVATAISTITNVNAKDIVTELGKNASSEVVNTAKEAVKNKVSESNVGKAVETAKKAKEVYDNAPEATKEAAKKKASEAAQKGVEKANEAVNKGLKSLGL